MQTTSKVVTRLGYLFITAFCTITAAYPQEIPIPLIRTLSIGDGEIYSVAFSTDGKNLASSGEGPIISLWDIQTGRILKTLIPDKEYDVGMYGGREVYLPSTYC